MSTGHQKLNDLRRFPDKYTLAEKNVIYHEAHNELMVRPIGSGKIDIPTNTGAHIEFKPKFDEIMALDIRSITDPEAIGVLMCDVMDELNNESFDFASTDYIGLGVRLTELMDVLSLDQQMSIFIYCERMVSGKEPFGMYVAEKCPEIFDNIISSMCQ